ncbi:hypothetical protein AB6A40_003385 [Gnathostoma spinigerum]|uniref:Fibroblast growth factor 17 n=1 Tax=Gnathostoma spinigerum TaxID=75299 RepID=A0ABD6EH16_9BILA
MSHGSVFAHTTVWQLYNHCSSAFVQIYLRHANARGDESSHCLTDFLLRSDGFGRVQLENAMSGKFICFNKRHHLTVRADGSDKKCYFHERLTRSGYIQFQSIWKPYLYLGFNRKGKFQDAGKLMTKPKCFNFSKLKRTVLSTRFIQCSSAKRGLNHAANDAAASNALNQRLLYKFARESLLRRIRA